MNLDIPTGLSPFSHTGADPKKGGSGKHVKRPTRDNWREWGFDFSIVYPRDRLCYYVQHGYQAADGKWKFMYCLGSPKGLTNGVPLPDPEGVAKCQGIIVPGYNQPLHDAGNFANNKGMTQMVFRMGVLNWSTQSFQVFTFKEAYFKEMGEVLRTDLESAGKIDLSRITWKTFCQPHGNGWRIEMRPVYPAPNKTVEDIKAFFSGHADQYKAMTESFVYEMTEEQIRAEVGAAPPAAGNVQPGNGLDFFGTDDGSAGITKQDIPAESDFEF